MSVGTASAVVIEPEMLKTLRKKHGLTQKQLADKMGLMASDIRDFEKGTSDIDSGIAQVITEVLGLNSGPPPEDESQSLRTKLHDWRKLIDFNDMEAAAQLQPELKSMVKISNCPEDEILYCLYAVRYYRTLCDFDAADEIMHFLSFRTKEIFKVTEYAYLYHRLVGMGELAKQRYIEALDALLQAEELDKSETWADVNLFYAIGKCLTDMYYPIMAIVYLRKAQYTAERQQNNKYDLYIQCHLAYCFSVVGQAKKGIAILDKLLDDEVRKTSPDKMAIAYLTMSWGLFTTKWKNTSTHEMN